ncbi:hypothetical protein JQ604_14255 [Bradyrhizobium jicamae]|uniref:COG3904 family protein n=1 Tax=Bradyrhizobium jicamae TaxID=280332 RepID=UPI001BA7C2F7|nr:hypothetical protein [Bradyrhizobium jicamae]MBR0753348.1 hypothetical protein [Bradyrhizobium jicamae]
MALRVLLVALLVLFVGPAVAANTVRPRAPITASPPVVFYVAKGAPDACGHGCDTWIAVEGQIDGGAAARFKKFLAPLRARNLPIYFSSPGGNLDQAVAMGAMLREKPTVARVARTVVRDCGFEAQDSEVCLKLKRSGREVHADLWTRYAMCNSACPYLMLGATTREIAPDAVLGVHSPKVIPHFRCNLPVPNCGTPSQEMRSAATQRGLARADTMLTAYIKRMGVDIGLLHLANTVPYENMHVLTRDEITRFGIDTREQVETPWQFENSGRSSMVRKIAVQKGDDGKTYRMSQWRLFCFTTEQFELDFQRPAANGAFATVAIAGKGPVPLHFTASRPTKPAADEVWGLRLSRDTLRSLIDQPQLDFTEATGGADGRQVPHTTKLSSEGLSGALDALLRTCPPPKAIAREAAAK